MPAKLTDEEFEAAVCEAFDSIPECFQDAMDNLMLTVEDEPEDPEDGELLGLYDGVSLLERDDGYGYLDMPDVITIYKGPHERLDGTKQEILEEVRKTVIHEIGHYFGMDEEQIARMGYE